MMKNPDHVEHVVSELIKAGKDKLQVVFFLLTNFKKIKGRGLFDRGSFLKDES